MSKIGTPKAPAYSEEVSEKEINSGTRKSVFEEYDEQKERELQKHQERGRIIEEEGDREEAEEYLRYGNTIKEVVSTASNKNVVKIFRELLEEKKEEVTIAVVDKPSQNLQRYKPLVVEPPKPAPVVKSLEDQIADQEEIVIRTKGRRKGGKNRPREDIKQENDAKDERRREKILARGEKEKEKEEKRKRREEPVRMLLDLTTCIELEEKCKFVRKVFDDFDFPYDPEHDPKITRVAKKIYFYPYDEKNLTRIFETPELIIIDFLTSLGFAKDPKGRIINSNYQLLSGSQISRLQDRCRQMMYKIMTDAVKRSDYLGFRRKVRSYYFGKDVGRSHFTALFKEACKGLEERNFYEDFVASHMIEAPGKLYMPEISAFIKERYPLIDPDLIKSSHAVRIGLESAGVLVDDVSYKKCVLGYTLE